MSDPGPPAAAPPRLSRLWWVAGPLLTVLTAALVALAIRPTHYYAFLPGSARDVEPLITFAASSDGGSVPKVQPAEGDVLFVTVSLRRPSGIETLSRLTDHTAEVVPEDQVNGGQSSDQNRQFNLQLMTDSKDKAAKVALERAGYAVEVTSAGAVVTDLDPSYPVAAVLTPGDTIVGIDGTELHDVEGVRTAIAAHRPGDSLTLRVIPFQGEARTVTAKLVARPDDATKAMLGVTLQDRPSYRFPFRVQIDSEQVGGPSAGLAFTLAILDRLTPGNLIGPETVAVTGTIELDGSVGPVGGVTQKTEAAIAEGAKLFLVPPDELADATKAARGRLEVRSVSSLDEALAALAEAGGDPLPAPAATTTTATPSSTTPSSSTTPADATTVPATTTTTPAGG